MVFSRLQVIGVLLAGALFRMGGLFRPLLGNFSIYQTAQAMVAKFFVEENFASLLYPKLNLLVRGEPSLLLLYYPLSSLVTAVLVAVFGGEYGVWGRLQAVFFFIAAAFVLYRLVVRLLGERMAFGALVFFVLCPLTIIYGQSFQSEMAVVFFTVLFFHQLLEWLERASVGAFVIGTLALSGVLLVRPNCATVILPAIYLAWSGAKTREGRLGRTISILGLFAAGSILPALWYFHVWKISQTASNIYGTVFAQIAVRSSFLSPAVFELDYYVELFDSLAGVVFTPIGLTLLGIGLFSGRAREREFLFFILWAVAFLAGSLVIPRKLLDHNFYLLHLALPSSIVIAAGFFHIYDTFVRNRRLQRQFLICFLAISFLMSLRYALHPAFKTPQEDQNIIPMAEEFKKRTVKNQTRVIVQGHHSFLYYADRYGWPFSTFRAGETQEYMKYGNWRKLPEKQWQTRQIAFRHPVTALEYLREYEGATHFVVVDPQTFTQARELSEHLNKHYRAVYHDPAKGSIFDLTVKR